MVVRYLLLLNSHRSSRSSLPYTTSAMASDSNPEIPKKSKAAVVVDEGPDFRVEIQEVDVPEPGELVQPPTGITGLRCGMTDQHPTQAQTMFSSS